MIYRVEGPDGYGPYRTYKNGNLLLSSRDYRRAPSSKHPGPMDIKGEDFFWDNISEKPDVKFGFTSMEQLKRRFDDEWADIWEHCKIVTYDTEPFAADDYQCVFYDPPRK